MVVVVKKQFEQNDAASANILGIEQGHILLFSTVTSTASRNSDVPRTVIGGVQLSNGEQKIYYRHRSVIDVISASLNTSGTLCCFVVRTETYDVYITEVGTPNIMRFPSQKPITAVLGPYDIILLFANDTITSYRMLQQKTATNRSFTLDLCHELRDFIYYQWDTLQQRLHIIKRRPAALTKTTSVNDEELFVYTAYTINSRGQFDSIMKVDFDLRVPQTSLGQNNFEILSTESSLFLCWQMTTDEKTKKTQYAVISFGHGRTFHLSPSLKQENSEEFKSRKVHFGLLDGDYVFVILRDEFIHVLNFNIQFHFLNNLIYKYNCDNLLDELNYTTQRGLVNRVPTLLYGKRNLAIYTIEISPIELIKSITPTNIYAVISYATVAPKEMNILQQILEKILFEMYDDLNTKSYLMEVLTALIYMRIAKRHHNKHALAFMATTVDATLVKNAEVGLRDITHPEKYRISRAGTTSLDQEYCEKLRTSFDHVRICRDKVSYYHTIMPIVEEQTQVNLPNDSAETSNGVVSALSKLSFTLGRHHRPASPRHLDQKEHRSPSQTTQNLNNQSNSVSIEKQNTHLSKIVSSRLQKLKHDWDSKRREIMTSDYIQATQSECDFLVDAFVGVAKFNRKECLNYRGDQNFESPSEKYKSLLVVIEKLYLAVIGLGFAPTEKLRKILLEVSFCVMPFIDFVAAVDQDILILTQEFVEHVIAELNNDHPKSYSIKEQLILMLPNSTGDSHSNLFDLIQSNPAKCMSAQILITRSYASLIRKTKSSAIYDSRSELENLSTGGNNDNNHSRLVEQALVSFYRDCCGRNNLDTDELRIVKRGLLTLTSSVH